MSDETATEQPQQGMRFNIQRIYIKDSSFEAPRAPQVFQETWEPKMHLDMNTRAERVQDNVYEVTLGLTLRVTDKEERTAYIAEVQQAGVFTIEGLDGPSLARVQATACPAILFPYGREAIDSLATRGSFPPVMLAPVNFDALYQENLARQQAAAEEVQH